MSNTDTITRTDIAGYSDDQLHITGRYEIHMDVFGTWDTPVTLRFSTGRSCTVRFGNGWEISATGIVVDRRGEDHTAHILDDASEYVVVSVAGTHTLVTPHTPTGIYLSSSTGTVDAGPLGE